MAGKLWSTVFLSLALSGFFCEEDATSMSTVAATTIKVQSSQSPDNQTNTTVRLEKESEAGPKNNSGLTNHEKQDDASYIGIILPVVIALIVISVIVFLLMALYRMCLKTTPGVYTFVNHTTPPNRAPSDKENVKLISVKTTSSDSDVKNSCFILETIEQSWIFLM
ncbi:Endomucin, partial [Ophiophagus hannah]